VAGRIRSASRDDAEAIQQIYAPFVREHATSFETVPPDRIEVERRIADAGTAYPWLVYEERDAVLGYAYASQHSSRHAYQWSTNVSVYIDPRAQRRGIARCLYSALFDVLRRQRFVNAYGGITLPNPASLGLHISMGFVPVGVYRGVGFKFGRWHDVMWLHLRLRDDERPAGDPLPVDIGDPAVLNTFERCAMSVTRR